MELWDLPEFFVNANSFEAESLKDNLLCIVV